MSRERERERGEGKEVEGGRVVVRGMGRWGGWGGRDVGAAGSKVRVCCKSDEDF